MPMPMQKQKQMLKLVRVWFDWQKRVRRRKGRRRSIVGRNWRQRKMICVAKPSLEESWRKRIWIESQPSRKIINSAEANESRRFLGSFKTPSRFSTACSLEKPTKNKKLALSLYIVVAVMDYMLGL